ncbi:MAG TPA: hypothetical protein VFZ40_18750 [Pyrinomonadaceae bacterium]
MATQLNYDIVPDKSPLYTTVDQLNQSTCALRVTATNAGSAPVTINVIEIELKKVDQGVDTVQLLLPGSESGITWPQSLTGPGGSNWNITNDDGKLTLKPTPDGSTVTFQQNDNLSFTLQNVVIREGGDGTALVHAIEASDAGRGETEVGIGITESTLDVQLSVPAGETIIGPGQQATLKWVTNDASSGVLTMPGNSPNLLQLDSTNLASGQQSVHPIGNTTYSLTCQGRGPSITRQVNVTIDEVTANIFGSANAFDATETITLSYQTSDAVSCLISLQENPNGSVTVPVANGQTKSCYVSATPDGQTLVLTSADSSNQELGRLTLPNPCPPSVTFVLTAEGAQTSAQPTFMVNLIHPQISFNTNGFSMEIDEGGAVEDQGPVEDERGPVSGDYMAYGIELDWNVSHASSVVVAVNGHPVSTSPSGSLRSGYNYRYPPSGTITCQGFGGPVGQ